MIVRLVKCFEKMFNDNLGHKSAHYMVNTWSVNSDWKKFILLGQYLAFAWHESYSRDFGMNSLSFLLTLNI